MLTPLVVPAPEPIPLSTFTQKCCDVLLPVLERQQELGPHEFKSQVGRGRRRGARPRRQGWRVQGAERTGSRGRGGAILVSLSSARHTRAGDAKECPGC